MPPVAKGYGPRQVAAAVMCGTLALLVLGLQPLLYGAYVAERVVAPARLGLLGAIELAGIAGGSALAVHLLSRLRAQIMAVAAVLLLVAGNAVHPQAGQWGLLFLARLVAGAGAGVLVGLAAGAIARTSRMGAWSGAFLFGQALSQFALMRALMSFSQDISSYTVQLSLAASALPVLALLPLLPRTGSGETEASADAFALPQGRGLLGLIAVLLCVGGTGGLWGYLEVWMNSRGVAHLDAASLISISLLGQIIGSAIGGVIADGRWAWLRLSVIVAGLLASILAWLHWPSSGLVAFAFGASYALGAPAFAPVLAQLDPLHRAIPFAATAQLLGLAVIPTLAGELLAVRSLELVLLFCFWAIALGLVLILSQARWLTNTTATATA